MRIPITTAGHRGAAGIKLILGCRRPGRSDPAPLWERPAVTGSPSPSTRVMRSRRSHLDTRFGNVDTMISSSSPPLGQRFALPRTDPGRPQGPSPARAACRISGRASSNVRSAVSRSVASGMRRVNRQPPAAARASISFISRSDVAVLLADHENLPHLRGLHETTSIALIQLDSTLPRRSHATCANATSARAKCSDSGFGAACRVRAGGSRRAGSATKGGGPGGRSSELLNQVPGGRLPARWFQPEPGYRQFRFASSQGAMTQAPRAHKEP